MAITAHHLTTITDRTDGYSEGVTIDSTAKVALLLETDRHNGTDTNGWIESCTIDGQSFVTTGLSAYDFATRQRTQIWYLIGPNTGASKSVVINRFGNASATRSVIHVGELRSGDTLELLTGSDNGNDLSGTSIAVNVGTTVGSGDMSLYLAHLYNSTGTAWTPGTGETELADAEDSLLVSSWGYNATDTGTVELSASHNHGSSRTIAMAVCAFTVAGAAVNVAVPAGSLSITGQVPTPSVSSGGTTVPVGAGSISVGSFAPTVTETPNAPINLVLTDL